jgi:hypothetical protein
MFSWAGLAEPSAPNSFGATSGKGRICATRRAFEGRCLVAPVWELQNFPDVLLSYDLHASKSDAERDEALDYDHANGKNNP